MTKIPFFLYSIKESVTLLFVHPRSQLFQALNFLVRPREREGQDYFIFILFSCRREKFLSRENARSFQQLNCVSSRRAGRRRQPHAVTKDHGVGSGQPVRWKQRFSRFSAYRRPCAIGLYSPQRVTMATQVTMASIIRYFNRCRGGDHGALCRWTVIVTHQT